MIAAADLDLFRDRVDGSRRIVITTHMNPDGDAIGSEGAFFRFLLERGKDARIVNHDPTPPFLRFLEDAAHPIEIYDSNRHDEAFREADLVVLLDNSAPDRLGGMEPVMLRSASRILCIDHHPTRGTPWAWNVLDEEACATAEIVHDLGEHLGWTPDPPAAQALYVGLATDTGFFRFNSTTPRAHEIAAQLLRLGVDPARCYQEVYERNPATHTRLLGHALAGMRLDEGGAVASVRITQILIDACNARSVDTSEMTTALLATDGVRIAVLFRELEDGRIKVSLRSKGELDVHRLASEFGGGGHRNASGIVVAGIIDEVERAVLRRASDLIAGGM